MRPAFLKELFMYHPYKRMVQPFWGMLYCLWNHEFRNAHFACSVPTL